VVITGCSGGDAGAIKATSVVSLSLTNTVITDNIGQTSGAVSVSEASTVVVSRTAVTGNVANGTTCGGGVYVSNVQSVAVVDSDLSVNTAVSRGGGLCAVTVGTCWPCCGGMLRHCAEHTLLRETGKY
jgi:nitrous oxidase accessory protein NosD